MKAKVCTQRKDGFCKKCRKDIKRKTPVYVVRSRPYCERCAASVQR